MGREGEGERGECEGNNEGGGRQDGEGRARIGERGEMC